MKIIFLLLLISTSCFGYSEDIEQELTEPEPKDYFHNPKNPNHNRNYNNQEYNSLFDPVPGAVYRSEQSNFVGDKEYRIMTEWNNAINDYLYSQVCVTMIIKTYLNETSLITVTNLPIRDNSNKSIADYLIVNLVIDDKSYKVNPLSPYQQAISKVSPTYWQWEVTPLKPGIHDIKLTFSAGILENSNYITSLYYRMHVTASWSEKIKIWIEENKDGVVVSTLLTILSAIGAYVKKKYFPKLKD